MCEGKQENPEEWRFFRNQLRDARYDALADAEGFGQLCFAFELLGSRLCGKKQSLSQYEDRLKSLCKGAMNESRFNALFRLVLDARNDVMHTGAYARNAAHAAVQLSLILEEGLMSKTTLTVADYMVTTPVYVEEWHTLGYARQRMLVNSFSYLPIFWDNKWQLISDFAVAKFFRLLDPKDRKTYEAQPIKAALGLEADKRLNLTPAKTVTMRTEIDNLLEGDVLQGKDHPGLWVVVNGDAGEQAKQLAGVLSPFELM